MRAPNSARANSIPAIFAVTSEPFLVFTANAFAILGLRAMYFLLADLIHRFIVLKIGLAFVLIWVGIKMLLLDVFYIPTTVSLAVVATIITVSIVASLRATRDLQLGRFASGLDAGRRRFRDAPLNEHISSSHTMLRYATTHRRDPKSPRAAHQ